MPHRVMPWRLVVVAAIALGGCGQHVAARSTPGRRQVARPLSPGSAKTSTEPMLAVTPPAPTCVFRPRVHPATLWPDTALFSALQPWSFEPPSPGQRRQVANHGLSPHAALDRAVRWEQRFDAAPQAGRVASSTTLGYLLDRANKERPPDPLPPGLARIAYAVQLMGFFNYLSSPFPAGGDGCEHVVFVDASNGSVIAAITVNPPPAG